MYIERLRTARYSAKVGMTYLTAYRDGTCLHMKKLNPSKGRDTPLPPPRAVTGSPKGRHPFLRCGPAQCPASLSLWSAVGVTTSQLFKDASRNFLRARERTVNIPGKYSGPEVLGREPWDMKGGSKARAPPWRRPALRRGAAAPGLWLPVCSDGRLRLFSSEPTLSCDADLRSSFPPTCHKILLGNLTPHSFTSSFDE